MPSLDSGSTGPYLNSARAASIVSSINDFESDITDSKRWRRSKWRHTLGISLLLCTVFLWTASNFLASTIFADDTYSKPFLVTYINSAFFIIPFIPLALRKLYEDPQEIAALRELIPRRYAGHSSIAHTDSEADPSPPIKDPTDQSGSQTEDLLIEDDLVHSAVLDASPRDKLNVLETARLSFGFAFLWFAANYFMAACLTYTTVASSTILTSTSSIWTLLIGTLWGVEHFTLRKLLGVLASLSGIILIQMVDVTGGNEGGRGTFPHKTRGELMVGNLMAFVSAVLYGVYAVVMKFRIGDEGRVDMPLFFGMVGLFNTFLLWPVFIFLHQVGIEEFELPPDWKVVMIIIVNSTSSLISDFCWAYAMLLTSPLIVTVGLSMTIPLSLVGQMLLDSQYSSVLYWFGAAVVLCSFIFVNREEVRDEDAGLQGSLVLNDDSG